MCGKFMDNCRKPQGRMGRMMMRGMNFGHSKVHKWVLGSIDMDGAERILDVGCGGGANINRMLLRYPDASVDGLDYSEESVTVSRKKNSKFLGDRCSINQGNVMDMDIPDGTYDYVTAMETVYFWPDLVGGLKEIGRVLKDGGTVVVVCELNDPVKGEKWSKRCEGMKVYTGGQIGEAMADAGFRDVSVNDNGNWTMVTGVSVKS